MGRRAEKAGGPAGGYGVLGAQKEVNIGLGQLWARGKGRQMEMAPWRRFGMKGRHREEAEEVKRNC